MWAWLRYWYLDTANIVNLYLIDRGYYDYDFEKVKKPILLEKTVKSDEEVSALMRKFGIGQKPSAEELQAMARKELEG